ncbi:MAG: hypothetical protein HY928_14950 [Elusimicrobia bacterium]|nr:hypothetical protein [Elusimicrobiota bacterium]
MNLKYGLTPDWTMDSTYNPDFSQIEADQPQIQVNQRFPLFYSEKRPFFMEGSDIFSTPLLLVHTRTLVDPEYGLRLTGQEGPVSAGALRARDRSQGGSSFDIARVNAAVGRESTLGGIYSSRGLQGGQFNRLGGVDGTLHFRNIYTLNFQAVDSFSRKNGAHYIEGAGYRFEISRAVRKFFIDAAYTDLHPNFRADSGFISRVDIRDTVLSAGYRHYPNNGSALQSVNPSVTYDRTFNHKGTLTDELLALSLSAAFPYQTSLSVSLEPSTLERFGGADFHKKRADFSFSSEPTSYLSGSVDLGVGEKLDYGAAVPFLGDALDKSASVTIRPTSRLSLEQRYIGSRLDTKGGRRVFDENIWREKATFQWNREVSTRIVFQYGTLRHRGFASFLTSYLLMPGTAVHVGYDWSFGRVVSDLQTTRRLVFAKASYLFRL